MNPDVEGDLEQRLERLQALLRDRAISGAVLVQAADLFYFTGSVQDAHLVVPADGQPVLYVRRSLERASLESPLERIEPLRSLRDLPRALSAAGVQGRVGVEMDVLPAARFQAYAELLTGVEFVDCSALIRGLRARKSSIELDLVERAAAQLDAAFAAVPALLVEGISELELQAELERILRLGGHDGFVRARSFNQEMHYGFVLGGESAAVTGGADAAVIGPGPNPAVGKGASRRAIRAGEAVLVDLVGSYGGYVADETRTFAIGALPVELSELLVRSREILASVAAAAKPGVTGDELYRLACALATELPGFMGLEPVSFVGHGVGLEIGEPPYLARGYTDELEEGNVFALEPKFVVRGVGAVGIENTYVVEASGVRQLTCAPDVLEV